MTQARDQGEQSLVFNDTAELFEAHRSSLEVYGPGHAVTKHLLSLMNVVVVDRVPLEFVADVDEATSVLVLDALTSCVREDPWRQAQADRMLAGIGHQTLSVAA